MKLPTVKRKSRMHISYLLVITMFAMVLFTGETVSYGGTTMEDLEKQMEDSLKAIEEAQAEYKSKDTEISVIYSEMAAADLEIQNYGIIINDISNQIAVKEQEIADTLVKLDEAVVHEEEYYEQMKERIRIIYEHGSTEYLEVLFESKSTADFFNRLEYLTKIAQYDDNMLDELEAIQQNIIDYEASLNQERLNLEDLKTENILKLNEVQIYIEEKGERLKEVENDKVLLQQQIEEEEKAVEKLNEEIEEYLRKYSDYALLYEDGKLSWPTPGYTRITSVFGPRIHPVYGYKSNHTGIDLAAPYGANIVASASGIVIFAGWGTAYGNYVLIDHGKDKNGNHIVTQYAHCSSLLVAEGDSVGREQIIAKVGSTGWSTGNHLHYGVQIGGEWVDPMDKLE